MVRRMRVVMILVFLFCLVIPAAGMAQAQPTAASLTVTPATAAPGD